MREAPPAAAELEGSDAVAPRAGRASGRGHRRMRSYSSSPVERFRKGRSPTLTEGRARAGSLSVSRTRESHESRCDLLRFLR